MGLQSTTSSRAASRNTASSMREVNPENEFKVRIDAFETCLLTPIVSGEVVRWLDDLHNAWTELKEQVHYHTKHVHPRQYEEIAKQDAELLPRIELLKAEDMAIDEHREKLNEAVVRLSQHVAKLEPDEEKAKKHMQNLIGDGTAFLTSVRKQSIAVRTWYGEAFSRDHGAVD